MPMNEDDLQILLQEGEGTTLEYKESLSPSFTREIVGMANTRGGRIILGVRDDGTVVGVRDSNAIRARLQDFARNCDPPIHVTVEPLGSVILVTVRESDAKPVQCSEGFFWRQGAVTQKLSRDEIRSFFQREGSVRFDLNLHRQFRYPQDFDPEKFSAWLALSRITAQVSREDILVNIEAAERAGGELIFRNAGVLFFAREPRRFFNQAYVTCLLFRGRERVDILDRKDFAGGVVADIEDALRFVERNTRTAYRIQGLRREEVTEYPMPALREAVTNAVMHRDWFNEGANVFVEVLGDRITISNPGGLPAGLTAGELGSRSVRRNPLIADLLHRIGFIEKAGTGIGRMREEARRHGCPAPRFVADGFFTATFRPLPGSRVTGQDAGQVTGQVTGHVAGHVAGEVGVNVQAEITDEVRRLLALLAEQGPVGRVAAQVAMGLRSRANFLQRYMEPALRGGLVEMTVPDHPNSRVQRYRITPAGVEALAGRGPATKE
jgi:ATP-dependent DNA helicase RecG